MTPASETQAAPSVTIFVLMRKRLSFTAVPQTAAIPSGVTVRRRMFSRRKRIPAENAADAVKRELRFYKIVANRKEESIIS